VAQPSSVRKVSFFASKLNLAHRAFKMGDVCAAGYPACGNSGLFCHSERSEESLFDCNPEKERFLGAQRASE
jgi:hypothetical protein